MKNVDYIVVGLGIAGICMCEQLSKNGKTFIVIDNGKKGATANSGGVFNPTVLKRFNAAWNTSEFYPVALSFYRQLSQRLKMAFFVEMPILRIFKNVEEQNNWSVASDKRELQQFLTSDFIQNKNANINAVLGFGKVVGTAKIDTKLLLEGYRSQLFQNNQLVEEEFQWEHFQKESEKLFYREIQAGKIIFCDGPRAMENPLFPNLAIIPNKGEYIIINAPDLNLKVLLKGSMYIIPMGGDLYKVGATFGRDDITNEPSEMGRIEIIEKLKSMIYCSFEIVGETSGIRPTTKDRKPLIGSLKDDIRIIFFNGLGSRGFTMAPLLSEILYQNMEFGTPIPWDMDIKRSVSQ